MMKYFFGVAVVFFSVMGFTQGIEIYPPNWFVGLQDTTLQLILKQKGIGDQFSAVESNTGDLTITSIIHSQNKDYVVLNCAVSKQAKAGMVKLRLNGKKSQIINYELKQKQAHPQTLKGNDFIYLIMPDRFANGNTQNDVVKTMREKVMNRDSVTYRHGGDLQGVTSKLDYLNELGATTLWLTPFQENDEAFQSYHGYAITNHYKVDPRFGTMDDYIHLMKEVKKRNMKWILDLVFNHIGDGHWLYAERPFDDAVHSFKEFTRTNYRANTLMDPYGATIDQQLFTEGWFDHHMPDLNNDNPIVATFMIQNTIWWIETSNADGIRIDTYSYPEQTFMQQWYQQVIAEYPTLSVFGEIWEHAVPLQSYFVPKEKEATQNMQNVLDFQFCFAIDDAVTQPNGWTEGVSKLYYNLSQDYVYRDPYHHIIFTDNHDLDRFYAIINYDLKKWKAAMAIMMTIRGIPSVFYGTEILMRNKGADGLKREDFKGGWANDSVNKFKMEGRTAEENEAWNYLQKLAVWRKKNSALSGKMKQFIPEDGVYVYFRYSEAEKVMIVFNSNKFDKTISLKRYNEMLEGKTFFNNVLSNQSMNIGENIMVKAGEAIILEVR